MFSSRRNANRSAYLKLACRNDVRIDPYFLLSRVLKPFDGRFARKRNEPPTSLPTANYVRSSFEIGYKTFPL